MNRMNKSLLHIGVFAAISGISHCYASDSVAPLFNAPKDVVNIFGTLYNDYKKDFLAKTQKVWGPHLLLVRLPISEN